MSSQQTRALAVALSAVLGLSYVALLYLPAWDAPFQFDSEMIAQNYPTLQTAAALWESMRANPRRMLSQLSFAADFHLFGLSSLAFRLTNLAFHLANTLVVFLLLQMLLRQRPAAAGSAAPVLPAAVIGALFFALHPIQTQAVLLIWQRVELLACFFFLCSVLCWWGARRGAERDGPRWRGGQGALRAAALVAMVAAMLSKETAAVLPVVLGMLEWQGWRGSALRPAARLRLLAPFAALLPLVPVLVILTPEVDNFGSMPLLATLSDFERGVGAMRGIDYLLTQSRVVVTYLATVAFPVGQHLDRAVDVSRSFLEWRVLVSVGVLGGLALALWRLERRLPLMRAGVLWILLTLSVTSSIIPIWDPMFEYRMYPAMAGVAVMLASVVRAAQRRLRSRAQVGLAVSLLVIWIAALSVGTWRRATVWASPLTLYGESVRRSPANQRARVNYGWALSQAGSHDRALHILLLAVRLNPLHVKATLQTGFALRRLRQPDRALRFFEHAMRLDPTLSAPRVNRGEISLQKGLLNRAMAEFDEALLRLPSNAAAHNNLGLALIRVGRVEGGARHLELAASRLWEALFNLARLYAARGEAERARAYYERTLRHPSLPPERRATLPNPLAAAPEPAAR